MIHWKQKVAMAATYNNEYCQCMQNDPQSCRIKVRKFHFIIFWCFGVIEDSSQGIRVKFEGNKSEK